MASSAQHLSIDSSLWRSRLFDVTFSARCVLVVAPAGSGKTTLLGQYAAAADHPVAWLRADSGHPGVDSAATRLCRVVAEATGTRPPAEADPATVLSTLEAASAEVDLSVVMDDLQSAAGTEDGRVLELVMAHCPPRVRLMLAARRMPALEVPRVELGTVALVTADDLRFRSWEVEDLFRDVYKEPLPPADSALLARRTEGWAASLQLFHLATAGRSLGDRRRAVATLTRNARFVRGYLTRAVLDDLPARLRLFLRRTCVFDVLTAERCDRLLASAESGGYLDELERRQALTTSDDGGATFRYHELLRRHLEGDLYDELGATGSRDWHRRAGRVLEDEGAYGEAVRVYARADAWTEVRRLLGASGDRVAAASPAVLACDDALPAQMVEEDPWLALAAARQRVRSGQVREAVARYRRCEQLFERRSDRQRVAQERRLVALWSDSEPCPGLHWMDRLRLATMRSAPASSVADVGSEEARLGSAVEVLLAGDTQVDSLLGPLLGEAGGEHALAGLLARLVALAAAAARGEDVAGSAERLAVDAERQVTGFVARLARTLSVCTGVVPGPDAVIIAGRVRDECESCGDPWGAALASAAGALYLLLRDASAQAWAETAERFEALHAETLAGWARSFQALAALVEHAETTSADVRRLVTPTHTRAGNGGSKAVAALAIAVASHDVEGRPSAMLASSTDRAVACPWLSGLARVLTEQLPMSEADEALVSPSIMLRCFGEFAFEVQGRQVDGTVRPQVATVLRLLAIHAGEPVHRETLLALLWPEATPDSGAHSLHVAMSALRGFLGRYTAPSDVPLLARVGDAYRLDLPPDADCDILVFRDEVDAADGAHSAGDDDREQASLRAALAAYSGDLLPEDGPAEWVVGAREDLRLRAARVAGRLGDLELAGGSPLSAVVSARRACAIDPYRDGSWRTLIAAYEACGDMAEASRARLQYADMLRSLGVAAQRRDPTGQVGTVVTSTA